jgi:phosphomannomutase
VVSASALGVLAARRGAPFTETLTGFKWIMRATEDLAFGYEEALGYAVRPDLVRDKDGITAAVAVARLAAAEAAQGRTLLDRLDDLSRELGVTVTAQVSLRVPDLAASTALTSRLRAAPPTAIGAQRVESIRDLLRPTDTSLPPSDVLIFTLAGGARAVVRPSGTEPKLKIYLEATAPVGAGPADLATARAAATARVDRLKAWARSL